MTLFDTGIRPAIDKHLAELASIKRDYGDYWSASSAGYCMRKNLFERLGIPYTSEDARKQRVFSAGDVFHEWVQRITRDAGLSIAQELELQDDKLMVRGHIDDLILIGGHIEGDSSSELDPPVIKGGHLILYDYKSAHSRSFSYAKDRPMSHYHKMQLATYMYLLRQLAVEHIDSKTPKIPHSGAVNLEEGRVMSISKDDLRMVEKQLLYTPSLEKEVVGYWSTLNGYYKNFKIPRCTCDKYEGGFMARQAYNPFWYQGKPCSLEWAKLNMKESA